MLDALRPTRIVDVRRRAARARGRLPVEEGDALVVATSGTSGQPKGVVLTHDAVAASAGRPRARLGIDPSRHTWLACLPLAHIGGLSVVTRSIVTGTPLSSCPASRPTSVEGLGRSGRATHVSLVATALQRLDPSVFRCVLLGGSKAPDASAAERRGHVRHDRDGLRRRLRRKTPRGGGGRVRAHRNDSSPGRGDDRREGEILVRAPMLFRCYRDGSDGRVVGPDGGGAWFATGDAGRLDVDGTARRLGAHRRRHHDRRREGLARPRRTRPQRAPGVAEVAVWKRSDPEWGERVVAWVVPG